MVEITSPPLPPPGRDNVEITSSTASWRAGGFAVKKKSATPQQPSDTMQMTDVPLSDQPPARARAQSSGLQGDISEHQPKFGEAIPWWKVVVAQLCYLLLTLLYVLLFSAAFSAGPYVFNALNVETWVSRLLWGASLGLLLLLYVFDFSYWPGSAGRWARRVGVGLVLLGVVLGGLLLSSAYPAFPMGMYLLCLPLFSLFLRGSLFARHGTGDVLRVLSVVFAVAGAAAAAPSLPPPPHHHLHHHRHHHLSGVVVLVCWVAWRTTSPRAVWDDHQVIQAWNRELGCGHNEGTRLTILRVVVAQQTSLIPLPPSAAGDLLALCDAQLLDAASCEEIYLHNATREASSGGEPPLMQIVEELETEREAAETARRDYNAKLVADGVIGERWMCQARSAHAHGSHTTDASCLAGHAPHTPQPHHTPHTPPPHLCRRSS